MADITLRVICVIPAYRAAGTIVDVVRGVLALVDEVVVIDDGCPEDSHAVVRAAFANNPLVHTILRPKNGGVGAAMKVGFEYALSRNADIVVKVDADGQMEPSIIRRIRHIFASDPELVCVKGNRFFDSMVLHRMPLIRLIGNALLSLMVKFASGYWNLTDPTNGYVALNIKALRALPWQTFANSYFFEISLLCELGLRKLPIAELEMPTVYNQAPSSLKISRVLFEFPPRLGRLFLRRIAVQYFVLDLNFGSLCAFFGILLMIAGATFGAYEWVLGFATHVPRAAGVVMLAVLPLLIGFQLLLTAILYDVQLSSKTVHHFLASLSIQAEPNDTDIRG